MTDGEDESMLCKYNCYKLTSTYETWFGRMKRGKSPGPGAL